MSSRENIRAMLILDIIGRPAQYLIESLEKLIAEMKNEKGTKVIDSRIREPVTMKESKEFFTTFSEIEVKTEDMMYLAILMFKYMPAHVEIISPEKITLTNNEFSEILSELTRRLHSYDEVARVIQAERVVLLKKLQEWQSGKVTKVPEEKKGKKGRKKKEQEKMK